MDDLTYQQTKEILFARLKQITKNEMIYKIMKSFFCPDDCYNCSIISFSNNAELKIQTKENSKTQPTNNLSSFEEFIEVTDPKRKLSYAEATRRNSNKSNGLEASTLLNNEKSTKSSEKTTRSSEKIRSFRKDLKKEIKKQAENLFGSSSNFYQQVEQDFFVPASPQATRNICNDSKENFNFTKQDLKSVLYPYESKYPLFNHEEVEEINKVLTEAADVLEKENFIKSKTNIPHIMHEILSSEEVYLEKLVIIIFDYSDLITLMQRNWCIFNKIQDLYDNCVEFSKSLRKHKEDYEEIPLLFLASKNLFKTYEDIIKQVPIAIKFVKQEEYKNVLKERRMQEGHKFELPTLINDIMKRLVSYIEFLKRICKELKEKCAPTENDLKPYEEAIDLIKNVMAIGNTFAALESIENNPYEDKDTGLFILSGDFEVKKKINHCKFKATIFLFDKMLIITKIDEENENNYFYVDAIERKYMSVQFLKSYEKYNFKIVRQRPNGLPIKFYLNVIPQAGLGKWKSQFEEYV